MIGLYYKIGVVHRARDKRRRSTTQQGPINAVKEGVVLDCCGSRGRPHPPGGVLHQQLRYQVLGRAGDARLLRELQCPSHDVRQRQLVVEPLKRRHSVEELEDEDPEGPPVDGAAVALAGDNLRS